MNLLCAPSITVWEDLRAFQNWGKSVRAGSGMLGPGFELLARPGKCTMPLTMHTGTNSYLGVNRL